MVSVNATGDRYGLSASAGAQFQHRLFSGDTYLQRSSFDGQFSGGLNLQSSIAIGGGKLSAGNHAMTSGAHTGVILDVESDLPEVALRADEHRGSTTMLKPGRNFIPVSAYKAGHMQIDFEGRDAPAAAIHPSSVNFHLNRGGVAYRKVKVMQTVTVIGQLYGNDGKPLKGAQVRNHVGRSVSEADGFFTLEMSERRPRLDIEHPDIDACSFELDGSELHREGNTLMVGHLRCMTDKLSTATNREKLVKRGSE
jgi:outer membrane usher protein FimD/PapC